MHFTTSLFAYFTVLRLSLNNRVSSHDMWVKWQHKGHIIGVMLVRCAATHHQYDDSRISRTTEVKCIFAYYYYDLFCWNTPPVVVVVRRRKDAIKRFWYRRHASNREGNENVYHILNVYKINRPHTFVENVQMYIVVVRLIPRSLHFSLYIYFYNSINAMCSKL